MVKDGESPSFGTYEAGNIISSEGPPGKSKDHVSFNEEYKHFNIPETILTKLAERGDAKLWAAPLNESLNMEDV